MVPRFMAVIALGVMAAGSVALAQENGGNATPNGNANPPRMMERQGGMTGSMMDMAQMNRMMENCNRMMESKHSPPGRPGVKPDNG
ncbi:MAG TPA: hypothetical protein VHO91_17725 [Rhodopila sp.]|nr:hypothetical protein [Rhodopila sp.]